MATAGLVVLAVACGGGTDADDKPSGPDGRRGEVVVNEDVRVLDETARQSLTAFDLDTSTNEGELRFDASSAFARQIEVGRILASEPIDGVAASGFLQRVESTRTEGDQIVVTTSQATLVETFDQAEMSYQQTLEPGDVVGMETRAQGIEMSTRQSPLTRRQPLGFDFGLDFDRVLVDADGDESTTDDQLKLDGNLRFNASARADIDIGWLAELDRFLFRIDLEESVDVEVRGTKQGLFDERIPVASYNFGSITIYVGPVPVVFNVSMQIEVGAEGQFEATMVATAIQQTSVTLGAEYREDDGWKNLSNVDSSFSFPPPELSAEGAARAFVEPRLDVRIYGLAGPFVLATAYVEADAELFRSPFWQVHAGLDFGVGFVIELPVVGRVASYRKNVEGFRRELGVAPNAAPSIELVRPRDGQRYTDGDQLLFEVDVRDTDHEYLDVVVEDAAGKTIVRDRLQQDRTVGSARKTLFADPICIGSHNYRVTVTDGAGASDTTTLSAVADNREPTVEVERGSAGDPFPGGYLFARATARDKTCESQNAADPALIGWFADGRRIGSTEELLYRLAPSEYADEDTFQLEARYDDGRTVGRSEPIAITVGKKPDGVDLEPDPVILEPEEGKTYVTNNGTLPFSGLGIDPEDARLGRGSLVWELKVPGGWREFSRAEAGRIDHFALYGDNAYFTSHTVRLTVTDSVGQSVSETVTYEITIDG